MKPLQNRINLRDDHGCEFTKWFDEITISRNISLSKAEKMLGIGHNTMKEWRRGNSKLSRYHIAGIVKIFDIECNSEQLEELYKRFGID